MIPNQSGLPTVLRQTLRVVHHPRTPSHISKDQHRRAPLSRRFRVHLGDEQHRADEEREDYCEEDGEDEGPRDGVVGLVGLEDGGHVEGGSEGSGGWSRAGLVGAAGVEDTDDRGSPLVTGGRVVPQAKHFALDAELINVDERPQQKLSDGNGVETPSSRT